MNRKIFSTRLRELRKSNNLTQQQLGELFDVIKQTANSWETGASVPQLEVAVALADYFGVSLDYLTGRTDCPKKADVK